MDEFMLMEYLKSKGMGDMSEKDFIHKFKEFMNKNGKTSYMKYHDDTDDLGDFYEDTDNIKYRKRMPMRRNQLGYYDMYAEYPEYALHSERKDGKPYSEYNTIYDDIDNYPSSNIRKANNMIEDHFNEPQARYIVSTMHHIEKGRKNVGEYFSMQKAKEVHERYNGIIPSSVNICDIYVAINAQYHDYSELFKSWFNNNVDAKIIESAIIFWFKDTDYDKGFKLKNYFKEY